MPYKKVYTSMEQLSDSGDKVPILSSEEIEKIVVEHQGWAESIARSVARAWSLDWRLDGLDGAALEALLFCARRFDPARGVPFKGYARKRIHEASSDQARKSKGWTKAGDGNSSSDQRSRELSTELLNIFPDLRVGVLPFAEDIGDLDSENVRSALRGLLIGASLLVMKQGIESSVDGEDILDYKRTVELMATLEPIHQQLLWKVYWDGCSLRTIARDWDTDELNVIREHQMLLTFLQKAISKGKQNQRPKVRPGLKKLSMQLKKEGDEGPFKKLQLSGV